MAGNAKLKAKLQAKQFAKGKPIKPKIRKGDQVMVISGGDRGRKGEVLKMLPKENRAVVQGLNMVQRHERQSMNSQGGIVRKEAPIHLSNLALLDPKTGERTKVGYKVLEDGRKVRVARKSGEVIDV